MVRTELLRLPMVVYTLIEWSDSERVKRVTEKLLTGFSVGERVWRGELGALRA